MDEKNNDVRYLNEQEIASVSGGGLNGEAPFRVLEKQMLTKEPHCRGCGVKIEKYGDVYKCKTEGCPCKGKAQCFQDLDWF